MTSDLATRLTVLHEVSLELSTCSSLSELCRTAVQAGRNRLGFDRVGIWFLDPEDERYEIGTYGIDETGEVRDERNARVLIDETTFPREFYENERPVMVFTNGQGYDHTNRPVGNADQAVAPMWNGKRTIGQISIDNLLTGTPIDSDTQQILVLFARTVGHLASLKRTEEELRLRTEKIQRLLKENTILMDELHHRIKNDLNLVFTLLALQEQSTDNREVAEGIRRAINRVTVMAKVYDNLHRRESGTYVDLKPFLTDLLSDLEQTTIPRNVQLLSDVQSMTVPSRLSVALGITVNEVVCNAAQHAFRHGTLDRSSLWINVSVGKAPDGQLRITVQDNGVGGVQGNGVFTSGENRPEGFVAGSNGKKKGFGLSLLTTLLSRFEGSIDLSPLEPAGTKVVVTVPITAGAD